MHYANDYAPPLCHFRQRDQNGDVVEFLPARTLFTNTPHDYNELKCTEKSALFEMLNSHN
jgi:hypothetical protein